MEKKILYVDDNPESARPKLEDISNQINYGFDEKRPNDFDTDSKVSAALKGKNIVLMDYELRDLDATPSVPIDGIELLERFRAEIRRDQDQGVQVPLLTVYTGKYLKLIENFGCPSSAPHLVARQANVDWVFEKGKSEMMGTKITGPRINAIFSGFNFEFRKNRSDGEDQLFSFLKLPEGLPWTDSAKEQVREARPPIQTTMNVSHCATLMRWLLQVALPIHGCFVDLPWVAMRLHLHPDSLANALQEIPSSEFSRLLDECRYKGTLADFYSEKRYWRAGVNHLIWGLTQGLSPLNTEVGKNLIKSIGKKIPILDKRSPVLLMSPDNFQQTNQIADMKDAVQVHPDFWPEGVDLPWIEMNEVNKDRELRTIVINEDRDRLPDD